MGKDPSYLASRLQTALTSLPQGRPLGFFLPDLLSYVGDKLGGLPAIYLLAFLIVTLNTFLCYRLLRVRVPVAPAVVGAAVFCLFPADTTRTLLTHEFQLQPSLTFALLAALAYATAPKPLSYVLAAAALLCYESGYLALFALPLFVYRWQRSMRREVVRHALVLVGILAAVAVLRFVVGEGRAAASVGSIAEIAPLVAGSLVLGPVRSVIAMFYGPLRAVPGWDLEIVILAILALVGFAAVLLWKTGAEGGTPNTEQGTPIQVSAAGAAMLILGYGLAFTHFPPNATVGRGTSVHLGATLGMAVLATGVAWLMLRIRPRLATGIVTAYLTLAVAYYVTIERDFMRSWQQQRAFWQQVVACCSDLEDATVLL
jgi:hypothetical protein